VLERQLQQVVQECLLMVALAISFPFSA